MKTSEYPYHQLPFSTFNIAQEAVVPFFDQDLNLVIALNTAVGKTAIAECIMAYHLKTDEDCKVVYTSPFKSISQEKYAAWKTSFKDFYPLLSTGDKTVKIEEYRSSRLISITSESLDSKTRNKSHDWVDNIACLIVDEAHLLGDKSRGANVEAALMRLSRINPNCRLILLSATMDNATEIAKWIKQLNGKETKCIKSDWRPSKVNVNYHSFDDQKYSEDNKIAKVVELAVRKGFGEKMIIFVHSKNTGKKIVQALRAKRILSAFHNASLTPKQKQKIEENFSEQFSGLDILVSTSTLSTGVNL